MTFGIDLGTTNSLIGYGDTLYSGLVSSNVDIAERKQVSRDIAGPNVVASYKKDMSTTGTGLLPQECSSIILKELADQAGRRSGCVVEDVVISVPAYFSVPQREAVKIAASKAGLKVKSLINEPTAAALYMCKSLKDLVLVYDLGGGTFDISLIDSRVGSYSVVATDGIILGGDDLDEALAKEVINVCKVPVRYRGKLGMQRLKFKMRLAKEQIQSSRSNIVIDFNDIGLNVVYTLTPERYVEIVREVFGKTIDMTQHIIDVSVPEYEKPKIAFVGGSSQCPYLKEMLRDELGLEEVSCKTAPDLIVAMGAAMYAQMVDMGTAFDLVEDVTKRLCIADAMGRTITFIENNSIIPVRIEKILRNAVTSSKLEISMYQGDSIMASECEYIGELVYDYGRVVEAGQGDVNVTIEVQYDGTIVLQAIEPFSDKPPKEIKLSIK